MRPVGPRHYGPLGPMRDRGGFTLIELVVSVAIASVLIVAIASAVLVASHALPDRQSSTGAVVQAATAADRMACELAYARYVLEKSPTAVTFLVPDRTGDDLPETVRYSWSGTPGDSINRTYNGQVGQGLVTGVRDFALDYQMGPGGTVQCVRIRLDAGAETAAPVETSVEMLNEPEHVARVWELSFTSDPTEADIDSDGIQDCVVRGGADFNGDMLAGGVWYAGTGSPILDTNPLNDFVEYTVADVRFRTTSVGGYGALFRIHADWTTGKFAVIGAAVVLQSNGTQTLDVYTKTDDSTQVPLVTCAGLATDFVDLHLEIDPDADTVSVSVNGVDRGTYTYSTFAQQDERRFATIRKWDCDAEFDHVSVRVRAGN